MYVCVLHIWVTEPELLAIKRCRRCPRGRLGGRKESYSTGLSARHTDATGVPSRADMSP